MKVIEQKPIPIVKVKEYVKDFEDRKNLEIYLKKFTKADKKNAEAIASDLQALNNLKIRERDITKVIDFLPQTQEEVNKIFTDVSLSEEEANAIIEIVNKY